MKKRTDEWLKLNRRLFRISEEMCSQLSHSAKQAHFDNVCFTFLSRGVRTLRAVNLLYEKQLGEQGQVLVRVLFENRVNFDWFIRIADAERERGIQKYLDGMNLEWFKQAEVGVETTFRSLRDSPELEQMKAEQAKIRARYSLEDFERLKKHGFTFLPMEQRARQLNYGSWMYHFVFRSFSRNVHASDHLELRTKLLAPDRDDLHDRMEDFGFCVAQFSLLGIAATINSRFKLGAISKLKDFALAQERIAEATQVLPKHTSAEG